MVRDTTISRSEALRLLGAYATAFLLALKFLYVLVEPVEAPAPELLEPADPSVNWLEAARLQRVEPALPGPADALEAHLAAHPQVLRRAGRGDAQRVRQVVDRAL